VRSVESISPSTIGLKSSNLKLKMSFCGLLGFLSSGISEEQFHKEKRIMEKREIESNFLNIVADIYYKKLMTSLMNFYRN
jgi:tRNA A37 threonylcarbamoyltransferase TsaD